MTTADDKRLQDQVNAANNAGAVGPMCLCPEGDVERGVPCIQCPLHGDGKDTRFPEFPDGCTTPECPGDPRYSAPGRSHVIGCTYPLPRADNTPPELPANSQQLPDLKLTPPDSRSEVEEPIEGGWYAYSGGAQTMVFHLRDTGQWSVHLDNGSAADCAWGYIEQALGVWDLVPLVAPAQHDAQVAAKAVAEMVELADEWYDHENDGGAWPVEYDDLGEAIRDRADRIEGGDRG